MKTYVVTPLLNHLSETAVLNGQNMMDLLKGHNICFHGNTRKIILVTQGCHSQAKISGK